MKVTNFSKLKKGELFRFEGKKKVNVFSGKSKKLGFSYYAYDDISSFKTTKTDRKVEIDFEF